IRWRAQPQLLRPLIVIHILASHPDGIPIGVVGVGAGHEPPRAIGADGGECVAAETPASFGGCTTRADIVVLAPIERDDVVVRIVDDSCAGCSHRGTVFGAVVGTGIPERKSACIGMLFGVINDGPQVKGLARLPRKLRASAHSIALIELLTRGYIGNETTADAARERHARGQLIFAQWLRPARLDLVRVVVAHILFELAAYV